MKIALISDTHDLLRPSVLQSLNGVERILHAGDVCSPEILAQLGDIAPVTAILGNCDRGDWTTEYSQTHLETIAGITFYLLHDLNQLDLEPTAAGIGVVLSGHSHRPGQFRRGSVWYINPGSAGPKRFTLPISLAFMNISGGTGELSYLELPA